MTEQVYFQNRNIYNDIGTYDKIKLEFLGIFKLMRALLDAELDKAEEYKFNDLGIKILTPDCEPIRMLECNHLIIKNEVVVGSVILRASNDRPTHGDGMFQDTMTRVYELRWKTFAGCDFSIESSGIAASQRNNGPILVNSCTGTGFADNILKRHWEEFKSLATFTAAEIEEPTKKRIWTKAQMVYSRA